MVSTTPDYTFTVTESVELEAHFELSVYTITATANPADGGTVSGGGTYNHGESCTVTATANEGYVFNHWLENGNVVSTQANYTFTVTGNRDLVAIITPHVYTIFAVPNPPEGGNTTGEGSYDYGQTCTLTATPATGYNFVRWTKNGQQVSTNATYTFTVTESAAFVAHFETLTYTITATANPKEGGAIEGSETFVGTYVFGDYLTITAEANEGYNFVNWTENGNVVSTNADYGFVVEGDRTLVANFELQQFEIAATVNPVEGGSITGRGRYAYGEEVTLTVATNENYVFRNWTENGEVVSEGPSYTFVVTSDRTLVANLENTVGIGESTVSANIYPNPTKDEVTVSCEGLSRIRIVNAYGQTVYNAAHEGNHARIDLSGMAKGVYVMHVGTENGNAVRQIVVE